MLATRGKKSLTGSYESSCARNREEAGISYKEGDRLCFPLYRLYNHRYTAMVNTYGTTVK
jgi:hypothetical protein